MRAKWALGLAGLTLAAGVALSRAPRQGGTPSLPPLLPPVRSPAAPAMPPPAPSANSIGGPAIPMLPAGNSLPVPLVPRFDKPTASIAVTENCPVPAFARALRAEARFQFEELSAGPLSRLEPKANPLTFTIDLPLQTDGGKRFADYLETGMRVDLCAAMLRDRLPEASAWLTQGLPEYLAASAARKLELDAACRRRVGAGEALPLALVLTKSPPGGGADQYYSLIAFLAQRRVAPEMRPAGDDAKAFVVRLVATDTTAGQSGPDRAAWEWGFQSADEMQAAWISWLKTPVSRPDWTPAKAAPPVPPPARPNFIPATDVSGIKPRPTKLVMPPPADSSPLFSVWTAPNPGS